MNKIVRIGEVLKELRGKRSLREIERISGVSHTYLSSIEKGTDPRSGNSITPTPEVIKKLAKAYDRPYLELAEQAGFLSSDEKQKALNVQRIFDPISFCELIVQELKIHHKRKHLLIPKFAELKLKYKALLGESFEFTKEAIRELGRELSVSGTSEEMNQFIAFYDDISKLFHDNNPLPFSRDDIYYKIKNPLSTYKGHDLNDNHRKLIIAYLDALFPDK
ncbi:helix-turn-helix domain-containing protein [Paenibacillus sp. MCAF9]|uniref:helix-turn-helix domain-containing protein n=1 Tax=Paenibacillus sp. MCAF9 TaxID=3233046 RepID=UPI003F9C0E88